MSEWSKLKADHHAWDHTKSGDRYVEKLWAEGDKIQLSLEILEEEALQQLHELDDCKSKLEALRKENETLETELMLVRVKAVSLALKHEKLRNALEPFNGSSVGKMLWEILGK